MPPSYKHTLFVLKRYCMTYNFGQEKYLNCIVLVFTIDYSKELKIIDFNTHLNLALPGVRNPRSTPKFPKVPGQNSMIDKK